MFNYIYQQTMGKAIKFLKSEKWTVLSLLLMVVCLFAGAPGVLGAEVTVVPGGSPSASPGQAGLNTQVPGEATTLSNAKEAGGDLIQPDIDPLITQIATDESVLDTIKRRVKRQVQVDSFEVDHYMIDEKRVSAKTTAEVVEAKGTQTFAITMSSADAKLFYDYSTAIVKGVQGYASDGSTKTEADLMLYCIGKNDSDMPKFIAVNGPKNSPSDESRGTPAIPSGSEIILLGSAAYETQERIAPNVVLPVAERMYLQKQLCNSIVSDYFDSQKKRIPFQKAQIAEAIVRQWRLENCRTAWVGVQSKFKVKAQDNSMGEQFVYTSKGLRWQIKRDYELQAGKITLDDLVYLSMFKFTGYNCSKNAMWIMGKELLANIQTIDLTLHKDISMANSEVFGIKCTKLKTVFGEIELVHDPVLDRLGYSKCGALLDMEGLVRYWRKNETNKSQKVEGEEATRDIVMCIDTLCLKGYSHIWVDGNASISGGTSTNVKIKALAKLPADAKVNDVVILTGTDGGHNAGEILQYTGSAWETYTGSVVGDAKTA